MILLTDEQQQAVAAELSVAATKRLARRGIVLGGEPVALTPDAILALSEGSILADANGYLWLAVIHVPGEVALCPFDDRQAFIVIADAEQPEGYRTFASRDGSDGYEAVVPALPLRYIGHEQAPHVD